LQRDKYRWLVENDADSTEWQPLESVAPYFFFVPKDFSRQNEYYAFAGLSEAFRFCHVGGKPGDDRLLVSFSEPQVRAKIERFLEAYCSGQEARLTEAKRNLVRILDEFAFRESCVERYNYRPFDDRWTYYDPLVWTRAVASIRSQCREGNLLLLCTKIVKGEDFRHAFVSRLFPDVIFLSSKTSTNCFVFPLYLYTTPEDNAGTLFAPGQVTREPNLSPEFIAEMERRLGMRFVPHPQTPSPHAGRGLGGEVEDPHAGRGLAGEVRDPHAGRGLGGEVRDPHTGRGPGGEVKNGEGRRREADTFGPEDVFNYIYALLHSPTYRQRYAEFLKIDFPRVPLTSDRALFAALVDKGQELVGLHLMESPQLNQLITGFHVEGEHRVERVRYAEPCLDEDGNQVAGRVYINKTQCFEGVPPEVWEFRVGGYQVCHKWLKDRKGRQLSFDDLWHYQRIVVALKQTIRVMAEIDQVIDARGGWPIE